MPKRPVTFPKSPVTISRNSPSVTIAEMTGHDAEIGGHDGPKYAIKQHLRIQAFVGYSANAVRTQIWTAISTYVMVAIVKKRLNVSASMHSLMQILSLNLFETVPLQDLFAQAAKYEESPEESPQLKLL